MLGGSLAATMFSGYRQGERRLKLNNSHYTNQKKGNYIMDNAEKNAETLRRSYEAFKSQRLFTNNHFKKKEKIQ